MDILIVFCNYYLTYSVIVYTKIVRHLLLVKKYKQD